jgi:hypothetical protein
MITFNIGEQVVYFYQHTGRDDIEFGKIYTVEHVPSYGNVKLRGVRHTIPTFMLCTPEEFYNDFCND